MLTRRTVGALALGGAVSIAGGRAWTIQARARSVGLFVDAGGASIPLGERVVRTTGYDTPGIGAATYVHDADAASHLTSHLRSTFKAQDGREFRLLTDDAKNPETLGLRIGLGRGYARRNREAIAEALLLRRKILLPAGDIDFSEDRDFSLPALDGMEVAGHGWSTRIVTHRSAFTLPTLSQLTIRDLWIEQVATAGATIQSLHCNLRDIRLIRLKITMRDQAACQNNCIGLVMDASRPGGDGFMGLKGLLVEDCWLAPGRMGIEIQNHRGSERVYGFRDIVVRGCTFWKAPAFAGMGVSLSGWGTDCLVSGNRFVACHGPNVELIGSDRTTVSDNIFQDAIGSAVSASNFRVIKQCRIIRNRTVGSPPATCLFLEAVDGAEVANNRFATSGVFVLKGSNIHLHDNVLVGQNTTQIIHLDHAHRAVIEKNVLRSVGAAPARHPMIIAFNTTTDCVIRFNRLERADYDVKQTTLWFAQATKVRGSVIYGNERRSAEARLVEPSPRR